MCTAAEVLIAAEERVIDAAAQAAAPTLPGAVKGDPETSNGGVHPRPSASDDYAGEQVGGEVVAGHSAVQHAEPEQLQRLTAAVQALVHLSHKV